MARRKKSKIERHDIFWILVLILLILGVTGDLTKPINPPGRSVEAQGGKVVIQNRRGADLVMVVDQPSQPQGVAIVAHGLGSDKDGPDVKAIADAFREHKFITVRYDASNSRGESGGYIEDAKATTYYDDLTDVVGWAQGQPWFKQPLVLAGHSLGATSAALYAEQHPGGVRGLVLISGVISGALHFQEAPQKAPADWEQTWQQIKSSWEQGKSSGKVNWFPFLIDLLRFDVLKKVSGLGMPVLIIAGEKDELAPVIHQQILYNNLPGPKELQIIPGAGHTLHSEPELSFLKYTIGKWIGVQLP
jgi:hypothetical protein